MREVTVTAREFGNYVWPAIAFQPVENGGEVDAHVRLLGKVKAVSTAEPTEDEDKIPGRTLDFDETSLRLEEDEWGRVKKVLNSWLPRVAGGVLDEYQALQKKVKEAEQESDIKDQ